MAAADVSGQGLSDEGREERNEEGKTEDCVVCLQQTREKSSQLFLYNCRCVYAIHANCFRDWRRMTETNRICLICREGLESFDGDEEGRQGGVRRRHGDGPIAGWGGEEIPNAATHALLVRPVAIRPAYGVFRVWLHRMDNTNKNLCLVGIFMCVTFLVFWLLLGDSTRKVTPPPELPKLSWQSQES
jgi:hypothetical protein